VGLVALRPRHKTHNILGKYLTDMHRDVANHSRDWPGLRWLAVGGGVSKTVALTFNLLKNPRNNAQQRSATGFPDGSIQWFPTLVSPSGYLRHGAK
jgi:hypothetical protein